MFQSSQFPRPPAFEQRDDTPTGYADQNAPLSGTSAGTFRSIVQSANAGLQKSCNTLGSINLNIQQSAVLNSVGDKLATLRNATASSMSVNKDHQDQGIFSGQSTASWGSVKENVSTFASKKVVPILNSNPLRTATSGFGDHRSQVEVSFNYQLMSDE